MGIVLLVSNWLLHLLKRVGWTDKAQLLHWRKTFSVSGLDLTFSSFLMAQWAVGNSLETRWCLHSNWGDTGTVVCTVCISLCIIFSINLLLESSTISNMSINHHSNKYSIMYIKKKEKRQQISFKSKNFKSNCYRRDTSIVHYHLFDWFDCFFYIIDVFTHGACSVH